MKTTLSAIFAASALAVLCSSLPMAARSAGEAQNSEYAHPLQGAPAPMLTLQLHDEAASASAAGTPAVLLYAGQVQVLDMPNVSRIAVGNGGVLKAQVIESGQVVLIGQAAGRTTLRVWTRAGNQQSYEVTVRTNEAVRAARDIQDMLAAEPGLKVSQYDGHVLIEGDYKDPATSRKLEAIAKMYPQIVVSMVPDHKIQVPVPLEKMVYLDVRLVEVRK